MSVEIPMPLRSREMEIAARESEFDHYATSKSVSQTMLNTTSIQTQIVILVSIFSGGVASLSGSQISLVVLISISLSLQFIIFVLLVVLAKSRSVTDSLGSFSIESINATVTSLSGLLLIVTSAISVLAISSTTNKTSNTTRIQILT